MYLPKLMNYLWEQPEIVASVIKHGDVKELKDHLAPFFANNFYENILSSYFMEDNLMFVLTLLLKDEINNLTGMDQESNFLKNTPCGCLLEELKRKSDIQTYFKTIIIKAVEKLEVEFSNFKINFEIGIINEDFKRKLNDKNSKNMISSGYLKKTYDQTNSGLDEDVIRNKEQIQLEQEKFNQNYIPPLDKEVLEKLILQNKDKNNLFEYCNLKLKDCLRDKDFYSNKHLLDHLYESDFSQEILLQYQTYFYVVITFINSIMDNIIKNYHLLPYSLKCLCKIISTLIVAKFPSITETERNAFIARFIFGKLLVPILLNPGVEAFISNFIISKNTLDNLRVICYIFKKYVSGNFFVGANETSDYTPFNWFFLEKADRLFDIFDHVTSVKLPSFIDKLINNKLPQDYKYDYFVENPDESINLRTICFNIEQVFVLVNTMDKFKDDIFKDKKVIGLKKTVEKLMSKENKKLILEIIKKEKSNPKPKLYHVLLTELFTNEKYTKLMKLEQITPNFTIKELKSQTEEAMMQNDIIRVKNFFSSLLYNYKKLSKTDFDEGTTKNTVSFLKELNKYMNSSDCVVDGSIPSEWYVSALLEYLEKIPKELTANDCEKLYDEFENDIKKSIKELDFEAISVILGKLKYTQKAKKYLEDSKKLLIDIKLNEDTKIIIEREIIPVDIIFNLDEEKLEENLEEDLKIGDFLIIQPNEKLEKRKKEYEKRKLNYKICDTISTFTKKFPNLVKYQELQDVDIFEIQKRLSFPMYLSNYFKIIYNTLKKKGYPGLDLIKDKIYDYVMGKVYDKVYPTEFLNKDNLIFQQSIRLSWTELKHFTKLKKKMVFGSFMNDMKKLFSLVDAEKSPRKKLNNLNEVYNAITFLLKFNGNTNDIGVDDQLPILNYALLHVHQLRMFSNGKYMELYIGDKKDSREGSQLTQLLLTCEFISKIQYSDLNDVTESEFIKKCNEETNRDSQAQS